MNVQADKFAGRSQLCAKREVQAAAPHRLGRGGPTDCGDLWCWLATPRMGSCTGRGSPSCSGRRGLSPVRSVLGRFWVVGSRSGAICLLSALRSGKLSEKRLSQRREAFAVPRACGFRHGTSVQVTGGFSARCPVSVWGPVGAHEVGVQKPQSRCSALLRGGFRASPGSLSHEPLTVPIAAQEGGLGPETTFS